MQYITNKEQIIFFSKAASMFTKGHPKIKPLIFPYSPDGYGLSINDVYTFGELMRIAMCDFSSVN